MWASEFIPFRASWDRMKPHGVVSQHRHSDTAFVRSVCWSHQHPNNRTFKAIILSVHLPVDGWSVHKSPPVFSLTGSRGGSRLKEFPGRGGLWLTLGAGERQLSMVLQQVCLTPKCLFWPHFALAPATRSSVSPVGNQCFPITYTLQDKRYSGTLLQLYSHTVPAFNLI